MHTLSALDSRSFTAEANGATKATKMDKSDSNRIVNTLQSQLKKDSNCKSHEENTEVEEFDQRRQIGTFEYHVAAAGCGSLEVAGCSADTVGLVGISQTQTVDRRRNVIVENQEIEDSGEREQ